AGVHPLGRPERHHGADEHHSLDAEVENARALGEQLAERRVEKRRPVGDAARDQRDEERVVHGAASGTTAPGATALLREIRTRCRTSSSPPRAQKRMIPWTTPTS